MEQYSQSPEEEKEMPNDGMHDRKNPNIVFDEEVDKKFLDKWKLTKRKVEFCRNYVKTWDKKQSAIDAGYSWNGIHQMAYQLLKQPNVRAYIKHLLRERFVKEELNNERLKNELMRIAFVDPTVFVEVAFGKVKIKDLNEIPQVWRVAIKKLKQTKEGIEIEFYDKLEALRMLGQHTGFFEADNLQKNQFNGPAVMLPDNGRGDWKPEHAVEQTKEGEVRILTNGVNGPDDESEVY